MTTAAWVVGASGLLGSALSRATGHRPGWELVPCDPLPWGSDRFEIVVRENARRIIETAAASGGDWAVLWAAGAAVTSSTPAALAAELAEFQLVLDGIAAVIQAASDPPPGAIFYSSSAGGVYGGAANPPYDENTPPLPLSPYGRFKLDAEHALETTAAGAGVSTLAGRIANLYGPGQSLEKMQGIISHLAKAQYSPYPASIYVSLDTLRDYIFVRDCAELILDSVARLLETAKDAGEPAHRVKNLGSGRAVTIGELLGHFRLLAKGHPHAMLGSSEQAAMQALDLRVVSVVWPDLDARELTPLAAGIRATMDDILAGIQSGAIR